jgi:hypothetical protein
VWPHYWNNFQHQPYWLHGHHNLLLGSSKQPPYHYSSAAHHQHVARATTPASVLVQQEGRRSSYHESDQQFVRPPLVLLRHDDHEDSSVSNNDDSHAHGDGPAIDLQLALDIGPRRQDITPKRVKRSSSAGCSSASEEDTAAGLSLSLFSAS